MLHFLFPTDPLDPRRIDQHFEPQRRALLTAGFEASLVRDSLLDHGGEVAGIRPNATVVYRGWMIDAKQYRNLHEAICRGGAAPLASVSAYLLAHHLPNWYPLLRDYTAETVVLSEDADLEAEFTKLGWPAYFLKDYVKSLKTSSGSVVTNATEAKRVLDEMRRFRGAIEGEVCVRRIERFQEDSEVRYFVVNGRTFAPASLPVPRIAYDVAERIDHPFFTIDIALNEAGQPRLVEIGDGQVSDLVGWSADEFARMWQKTA